MTATLDLEVRFIDALDEARDLLNEALDIAMSGDTSHTTTDRGMIRDALDIIRRIRFDGFWIAETQRAVPGHLSPAGRYPVCRQRTVSKGDTEA